MLHRILLFLSLWSPVAGYTQKALLQSGPMVGYSDMREVALWVQLKAPGTVQFAYWPENNPGDLCLTECRDVDKDRAYTAQVICDQVKPGLRYAYRLFINNQAVELDYPAGFSTQALWQWRHEPPDFRFAAGSCYYIGEEPYERPADNPYWGQYEIISSIYRDKPDFMLWLGDNTYLREPDWNSRTGIFSRYTHTRSTPLLQPLLANTHHYAIWDDHDFGPNNSDGSFAGKHLTREAFNSFWPNPGFGGVAGDGITFQFEWSDCAFFMLDDRFNKRSATGTQPGVILGEQQMAWLKQALKYSQATFKFVCVGVMFGSTADDKENFARAAPAEREELLKFISDENISGVVFLTGDRHFSELSRITLANGVTAYDLTVSPLTSGIASTRKYGQERNDNMVKDTRLFERNYAIVEVSGKRAERTMKISIRNAAGQERWSRSIALQELTQSADKR